MSQVEQAEEASPPPRPMAIDRPPGMGLYMLVWVGYFISTLGSVLVAFALSVTVYQETGSVSRYSLIGLVTLIPNILITPLVGVLADRIDRRKILIVCGISSALVNSVLYHVVSQEPYNLWLIYPLLTVNACVNAFVWPTFSAATTLMVRKEDLGRASGLSQIGSSVSGIIGPTLAALLMVSIGLKGIVLLNLSSYLVPTAILLMIRIPKPKVSLEGEKSKGTFWKEAMTGWTFIQERPALLQLLITFASVNLCMAFVHILMTPLILSFASPLALGLVLAVAGLGTLVGSIVMAVWGGPRRGRIKTVFVLLAYCSALLLLAGFKPNVTLVASGAFFFVLAFPIIAGCVKVIWQSKVPPDLQGRVFAMRRVIAVSTMPFALMVAGPLADDVLEPLMAEDGLLASSIGQVIGVGPGRGIGLLFIVLAFVLLVQVLFALRSKALLTIEDDLPEAIDGEDEPEIPYLELDAGLRRRSLLQAVGMVAILAGAAVSSMFWLAPPEPVPASAPAEVFSAERAHAHLATLARAPHPIGTEEHRRVRDYLVSTLDDLGLEVEVQSATVRSRRLNHAQVVDVDNVIARLPGTEPEEKAVVLGAHYDSVPTSPGASDNASAVAALLETARVLRDGPPLRRDVLFFFSDAEETGLHGAQAFVERHPAASEIGVMLNFDARGHRGPVYMFQTGREAGDWIPFFAEGTDHPVGTSLMTHLYQLLPNATDFLIFEAAEVPGFNFAFIDGLTHYHTMLDRTEDLAPSSLQHQGDYALDLTRRLADLETLPGRKPHRAYFNLIGSVMVHYPRLVSWLTAILAAGLYLAVLVVGLRRKRLTLFGLSQGLVAFLGVFIAVPVFITLLWMILNNGFGVPVVMGSTHYAPLFMLGFALLSVAGFQAVIRFFRGVVGLLDLATGALCWWLVLLVVTTEAWMPAETNYLFVWPLIFACLALLRSITRPEPLGQGRRPDLLAFALMGLSATVAIWLLVPLGAAIYIGLQSLTGLGGLPLTLLVLLLGTLIPHLELVGGRRGWELAIGLAVVGLGVTAVATWKSATENLPTQDSAIYAVDLDEDQQYWYSFDLAPDSWTKAMGFRSGKRESFARFDPGQVKMLRAEAEATEVPSPTLELLGLEQEGALNKARIRLTASEGAINRLLWVEPARSAFDLRIAGQSVSLIGREMGDSVIAQRLPVPAVEEVVLRWRGEEPARLVVVEQIDGLPVFDDIGPRPAGLLPKPGGVRLRSDLIVVRRSIALDAAGGATEDATEDEAMTTEDDAEESTTDDGAEAVVTEGAAMAHP